MLRIALDMDDVLADTHGKLVEIVLREFETSLTKQDLHRAPIRSLLHPKQFKKLTEIINQPGFFRDVPVMKDAQEVVKELSEYYEIFVASAAMEFRNSLIDKYDWLDEFFPSIHWKNRVLCGDKSVIKADYLIDDHAFNLVNFSGKGILFNAAVNLHEKGFDRVMDWQDIRARFLGRYSTT